ncbi:MAG: hypothetical protein CMM64_02450 [Rhodospirillaceae bacterium]|nr:hypothetical protein [Rhodospirillaceae bacterium]
MIKYQLKCRSNICSDEKEFDGWFKSIDAYEKQKLQRLINCPICGSDKVEKLLTAPSLKTNKNKISDIKDKQFKNSKKNETFLGNIDSDNISTLLRTLKKEVQKNSTFVGNEFVSQVRSMKEGKIKEKPIHGHGTNKEIKELRNEGIDVINIPWISEDH